MNVENTSNRIFIQGESTNGKKLRWRSSRNGTEWTVNDCIEHLVGAWVAVENAAIHLWARKLGQKIDNVKWEIETSWKEQLKGSQDHWSSNIDTIKVAAVVTTDTSDSDLEKLRQKVSEWNVIDQLLKSAGINFNLRWERDKSTQSTGVYQYSESYSESYYYSSGDTVEYSHNQQAAKNVPQWASEWKEWDVNDALEHLLGAFISGETDTAYWWGSQLGLKIGGIIWEAETRWNDKGWSEGKEGATSRIENIRARAHVICDGDQGQFDKLRGLVSQSSLLEKTFKKAGVHLDVEWKWENAKKELQQ